MESDSKYVHRVIDKYNRRHAIAFVQKRAERRFLVPLGLALKHFPPANFGNNRSRMNHSEEFELFTALHYMKYKMTRTKMKKCQDRYLQIYLALRNRGISANYRLVLDCVKRHAERLSRGIDQVLLIERGYMALISSVDGFDPWMGFLFSTYVCNSITRSFYNRVHVTSRIVSIDDADDIATEPADEARELWLERIGILLHSDHLNPREVEVLKYRFYDKLTLGEVGAIWGLTKERVRQIQLKAVSNLRKALNEDPVLS